MGFTFGENWKEFVDKNYSEERVDIAKVNLLNSLKLENLVGKTFLDIGLGSGIHSLAAFRAGAERVVSFDVDENCVNLGKKMYKNAGSPANWEILSGSALDRGFVESLGKFDIVYSWGVLHHTGDTFSAVSNARLAMNDEALMFIALYSYNTYNIRALFHQDRYGEGIFPEDWMRIKQEYNIASKIRKKWLEIEYVYKNKLPHPRTSYRSWIDLYHEIKGYKEKRGMSFYSDIKDWLGGWPMDFVKEGELNKFVDEKLGLELINMDTGYANTDFFYANKGSSNYLKEKLKGCAVESLVGKFQEYKSGVFRAVLKRDAGSSLRSSDAFDIRSVRLYNNNEEVFAVADGMEYFEISPIECYYIENGLLYYKNSVGNEISDAQLSVKYWY